MHLFDKIEELNTNFSICSWFPEVLAEEASQLLPNSDTCFSLVEYIICVGGWERLLLVSALVNGESTQINMLASHVPNCTNTQVRRRRRHFEQKHYVTIVSEKNGYIVCLH